MKKILAALFAVLIGFAGYAFVFNPAIGANLVLILTDGVHTITGVQQITVSGGTVGGSGRNATVTIPGTSAANPTATIGTAAVNGAASTFMRSDAAPAIPQCSSSTFGACKVDGSTITATAGVITATGGGGGGLSGQVPGEVPVAATSTTATSSANITGTAAALATDWINIRHPPIVAGSPAFPAATGNGSTDDTAAIQAAIDYAFTQNDTAVAVYCPAGSYKVSGTIYLDPPGNLRSNLANPTNFAFSAAFFGDPTGGGALPGCRLYSTGSSGIAFLVGTGTGMRVSDMAMIGANTGYRAQQSNTGVGIGLSGGSGGSSINLIESTYVANFYALYKTDANVACCLSDSNTFRKVSGDNGYYGIQFAGTQSDINDVVEARLAATIDIDSEAGRPVNVYGGNLSAGSGQSNSFGLSGISGFTKTAHDAGFDYTFTATVAAPDQYVNTVYNSYTIATAHFGVIPLLMTAWNSGTHVGTFQLRPPWVFANYGLGDLTFTTMPTEVAAVTTLYAAERVSVAQGMGIMMDGVHIENPSACFSLVMVQAANLGGAATEVRNPHFNEDTDAPIGTANTYCQRVFPFIGQGPGGNGATIKLTGGRYSFEPPTAPLLLETEPFTSISGSQLTNLLLNVGVYDSLGNAYGQIGGYGQFQTEARGAGVWDNNYYVPFTNRVYRTEVQAGELASPYCGYEPCPWTTPNLSPTLYADVSGSLGALGTYPPIACRTAFKSTDWNTGSLAHLFLRSASCPGYSWGQDLNDTTVSAPANSPTAVINGSISAGSAGGGGTWNPSDAGTGWAFTNSNFTATASGGTGNILARGTVACTSKPYFEATVNTFGGGNNPGVGIGNPSASLSSYAGSDNNSIGYYNDGAIFQNASTPHGGIEIYSPGAVVQFALDLTASPILFWAKGGLAGDWNNNPSANPATGTGGFAMTGFVTTGGVFPVVSSDGAGGGQVTLNLGTSPFAGTMPSGFNTCVAAVPSTLTVNSVTSGAVTIGKLVTGAGIPAEQHIAAGSGASWTISPGFAGVSSEVINLYPSITYAGTQYSAALYLDAKTLSWMFPGLTISLGTDKYLVTGVYPDLGYVTVMSEATANGGGLSTNYSCTSLCTIGQSAFAWTAY